MVKTGQFATKCKDDRHRSKMADITLVGLKFKIFTTGTGRCVIVPNVMSVSRSNHCRDMAIFRFFKMVVFRHVGFLTVGNFNCQYGRRVSVRHRAKFCANLSNCCRDIAVFQFLDMTAIHNLGFLKVQNFNVQSSSEAMCVTMPNYMPIGQTILEMRPFYFSRWRWSAVLDFHFKVQNFNCRSDS